VAERYHHYEARLFAYTPGTQRRFLRINQFMLQNLCCVNVIMLKIVLRKYLDVLIHFFLASGGAKGGGDAAPQPHLSFSSAQPSTSLIMKYKTQAS
jgi:hypothetical protein